METAVRTKSRWPHSFGMTLGKQAELERSASKTNSWSARKSSQAHRSNEPSRRTAWLMTSRSARTSSGAPSTSLGKRFTRRNQAAISGGRRTSVRSTRGAWKGRKRPNGRCPCSSKSSSWSCAMMRCSQHGIPVSCSTCGLKDDNGESTRARTTKSPPLIVTMWIPKSVPTARRPVWKSNLFGSPTQARSASSLFSATPASTRSRATMWPAGPRSMAPAKTSMGPRSAKQPTCETTFPSTMSTSFKARKARSNSRHSSPTPAPSPSPSPKPSAGSCAGLVGARPGEVDPVEVRRRGRASSDESMGCR
mmetsp:Transcript_58084/g.188016  ORF Transcript_58084/g.188016 Transcript_58084/m.188016 type:complete len:307 (+) Transcript_58084:633-1553(+)